VDQLAPEQENSLRLQKDLASEKRLKRTKSEFLIRHT